MSSDEPLEHPLVFAVDDTGYEAAEAGERAEGMEAPPPFVEAPRVVGGVVEASALRYPLIDFPREPWTLTLYGHLTHAEAAAWAGWLNETEASRAALSVSVLAEAGAPVSVVGDHPEALARLGRWVQQWFDFVALPYATRGIPRTADWRRGFFQDDPDVRLGGETAPLQPGHAGYSRTGDALLHSLAVDLAFAVTGCARATRPGLKWTVGFDAAHEVYYVTPDPEPPPFELVRLTRDFCVQSLARPRTGRGQELREWRSRALHRLYQRAATGVAQPPEFEAFPGAHDSRRGGRYQLFKPGRSDPPAPQPLVEAVAAMRLSGVRAAGAPR